MYIINPFCKSSLLQLQLCNYSQLASYMSIVSYILFREIKQKVKYTQCDCSTMYYYSNIATQAYKLHSDVILLISCIPKNLITYMCQQLANQLTCSYGLCNSNKKIMYIAGTRNCSQLAIAIQQHSIMRAVLKQDSIIPWSHLYLIEFCCVLSEHEYCTCICQLFHNQPPSCWPISSQIQQPSETTMMCQNFMNIAIAIQLLYSYSYTVTVYS